jgi:Predicted membrane protein (DUF2232)
MMTYPLVGIGAGLVSALLFAVAMKGSLLAVILSVLPSLPVLIAALGWNHRAGLIAAAVGGLALGLAFKLAAGVIFIVGWGLPAWWLAYLALLGRQGENGSLEWYPIGKLLLWIALSGALVTTIGAIAIGEGDYGAYREALRAVIENFRRVVTQTPADAALPPIRGIPADELARGIATAVPFAVASSFALVLAINLWLGAKVVAISQRLPRSWPSIPSAALPRLAVAALVAGIALAFAPGFLGVAGLALVGALGTAFALQGLAMIHDATRGHPARGPLLAATYFLAIFLSQVAWPLLAVAGLLDAAIGIRNRFRSGGAGPRST